MRRPLLVMTLVLIAAPAFAQSNSAEARNALYLEMLGVSLGLGF